MNLRNVVSKVVLDVRLQIVVPTDIHLDSSNWLLILIHTFLLVLSKMQKEFSFPADCYF